MRALRPPTALPPSADDALRQLFEQRAADVAAAPDIAGIAVGRARRITRRRVSIGGIAAAMAFVVTLGTAVSMRGWWKSDESVGGSGVAGPGVIEFDATATQQAIDYSPVMLRVDVSVGNRIFDSATGKWLSTGGADPADVVRVPLGWIAGDKSGIRLVQYDGTTKTVASGQYSWTVNGDGTQVAMVTGNELSIKSVTLHGGVEVASATIPAGERPVGFVASTVVLVSSTGKVDAWRPGDGPVEESELSYVYGSSQAETFGMVASPGSSRPCLAKVSAGVLGIKKMAMAGCHDLLAQGVGRAAVSPDGQHLALPFNGGMWIINLARSVLAYAANPAAPPVWVATCASDGDASPVWQDAKTVVTTAHGAIISCGVDGVQRDVRLPKDVNASARLVPSRVP